MTTTNEELIAALRNIMAYPGIREYMGSQLSNPADELLARADEPQAEPEKSVMEAIESTNSKVFSDPPKTAEDRFPPQKPFPNTSMCPQCPWLRKYAEPQAKGENNATE